MQIIPEIRSERRDLLIFIFILKTTGTFTPVHSAGYLILPGRIYKCHFTSGRWDSDRILEIHVSQSLAIIRNAIHIL